MEEDNTQYFNDEWNGKPKESYRLEIWDFKESGVEIYTLEKYNKLIKNKLEKLLQEELIKNHSNGITTLPKRYKNTKDADKYTK